MDEMIEQFRIDFPEFTDTENSRGAVNCFGRYYQSFTGVE